MSRPLERSFTTEQAKKTLPKSNAVYSEEKKAELRARIDEAARQQEQSREQLQVEEENWTRTDSLAASQRFFSSAALGWGDELGLWVGAAIAANVVYPYYDLETTTSEQYKKAKKEYDEQQKAFKKKNKTEALLSDIGGAVVSPATYLAAPAAVAARLPRATPVARAIGEGAVFGAGEADAGERAEGAVTGAAFGGAGYVLGKVYTSPFRAADALTRRRVEGDLVDESGDFVPLTLAASKDDGSEAFIHQLYRDVVGPAFGGKVKIRKQEDVIIKKAEAAIESQEDVTRKLDQKIKERSAEIDEQIKQGVARFKEEQKNLIADKVAQSGDTVKPLEEKLKSFKSAKSDEIMQAAMSQTRQLLDASRFNFRNETFVNSFPAGASGADVQRILSEPNIGTRIRKLDDLWKVKGYRVAKNERFKIKEGEFEERLAKALQNDDYFQVNTVDFPLVKSLFKKAIDDMETFKDATGEISGKKLMALRARVGQLASSAADPQVKRAIYTLQDEMDKFMKGQLSPEKALLHDKERAKWKSTIILREAIENAQIDPAKRGYFDENDWIREVSRNNRWNQRYGTGPLNKRARLLEFQNASMEKTKAKKAFALAKVRADQIEKTIKEHRNQLAKTRERLTAEMQQKQARLRNKPEFAQEIAALNQSKEAATKELQEAEQILSTLKTLRSPQNPSWFHTLAASSLLGGIARFLTRSALTAPVVGAAVSSGLASPRTQRVIAGQTPAQQAVQSALQTPQAQQLARQLEQATVMTGTRSPVLLTDGRTNSPGMLTDQ